MVKVDLRLIALLCGMVLALPASASAGPYDRTVEVDGTQPATFTLDLAPGDSYVGATMPSQGTLDDSLAPTFTYTADVGAAGDDVTEITTVDGTSTISFVVRPTVDALVKDPADDPQGEDSASFTFSSANASSFECRFDDATDFGPCTSGVSVDDLADGTHTMRVRGVAGPLTGPVRELGFEVLNTAPDAPDAATDVPAQADYALTLPGSDVDGDDLEWSIVDEPDRGTISGGTEAGRTYRGEDGFAGRDSFTYAVSDGRGGTDTGTVTLDVLPTVVGLDGPAQGGPTNDRSFTFSSQAGTTLECSLDGATFDPCTSPLEVAAGDLVQGDNTLTVRASADIAGTPRTGPTSEWTWTYDDVAPTVTIDDGPAEGSTVGENLASFAFSSDEPGTFRCSLDGAAEEPCDSPLDLTDLDEGARSFSVVAVDEAGNVSTPATRSWTVDNTTPTLDDEGPTAVEAGGEALLDFDGADADGDGLEYSISSAPTAAQGTASVDPDTGELTFAPDEGFAGRVVIGVTADDGRPDGGVAASGTFDVTPQTTVTDGPPARTTDVRPTLSVSAPAADQVDCTLDGFTTVVDCTGGSFTPADDLADGAYTFQARARHADVDAGELVDPTPAQRTFTVDTTAPDTQLDAAPPALGNDATPTFAFSTADANPGGFECSVDGGVFAPCTSSFDAPTLTDGAHTFAVRAKDDVGNEDATPASAAFTVDTTLPVITVDGPQGPTRENVPTWTFAMTDLHSSGVTECRVDAGTWRSPCLSPYQRTPFLADGPHTLTLRSTDLAGNLRVVTRDFTVDTLPPNTAITDQPDAVDDATARFAFTASQSGSTFECSLDGGAFTSCDSPSELTGLLTGTHRFRVRAKDPAGNLDPSPASYTWAVDADVPDTSITGGPSGETESRTAVFGVESTMPGSTFECSLDGAAFAACGPAVRLADVALGAHTLRVRSRSSVGTLDPTPASRTWTVVAPPPPPAASQPGSGAAGNPITIVGDPSRATSTTPTTPSSAASSSRCAPLTATRASQTFGPRLFPGGVRARMTVTPPRFRRGATGIRVVLVPEGRVTGRAAALRRIAAKVRRIEVRRGNRVVARLDAGNRWSGALATSGLPAGRNRLDVLVVRKQGATLRRTLTVQVGAACA